MIFGGRPQVPAAAPTPPAAPPPMATMASRVGNIGQAQARPTSNPFLNFVRSNRAPQTGAGVMNSAPGSAYTLGNMHQPAPQASAGITSAPVDTATAQQPAPQDGAGITSEPGNTANPIYTTSADPVSAAPPPSPTWHPMNLTGLSGQESRRARRDMTGLNSLYY